MTGQGLEQADEARLSPARARLRRVLGSRSLYLVLFIVVLAVAFYRWLDMIGGPEAVRNALGPAAPPIIVLVLALMSATPIPSELIAIPLAAIYGVWIGALFIWIAWYVASFIQYFVARRVASEFDFEGARARLPSWLQRLPVSHPVYLICARWIPYGPHIVNTSAGVFGVPLFRHAWCAALGIIPQAIFLSAVGNALLRL